MRLEYISEPNYCLTTENHEYLKIDACNKSNENQLWRWDKKGNLKNNGTENCAIVSLGETYLKLGRCDFSEEQLTCLPYTLKARTKNYFAAGARSLYLSIPLDGLEEEKWRRYTDPIANICNYTGKMEALLFYWKLYLCKGLPTIKNCIYEISFLINPMFLLLCFGLPFSLCLYYKPLLSKLFFSVKLLGPFRICALDKLIILRLLLDYLKSATKAAFVVRFLQPPAVLGQVSSR